jgi:uncharacterized protein (AIM24 family)
MADRSTLGTSALAITLAAGESVWAVSDSVIGLDADIHMAQRMPLPSAASTGLSGKASLGLYKNASTEAALLLLGGPMNSCLMTIEADDGRVVVRASSFVATNEGGETQSHEPVFNGHPDYEPMDWTEFKRPAFLVISGRGAMFKVPVDGEHLVDVDTIIAYNSGLTITPVASDGTVAAKRLAGLHQPIYRFTGRGSLWCQAGRTREFGRLLRPHLTRQTP